MKTYLILPEVFISYFTSDDREILDKIETIFKKVEAGEMKLLLSEGLFFVLAEKLGEIIKPRGKLIDCLEAVINLHNLKVRNEMVLRSAVLEMRKGKSFIEAYKSVVITSLSLDGFYNMERIT